MRRSSAPPLPAKKNILDGRSNRLRQNNVRERRPRCDGRRSRRTIASISIEDTTELQCSVRNHVDLCAVGSVSMLDCLRACMRLKPTRIVVGEVRGAEAHTMLKAWNTGHPGGAATVHANDALSGLIRLESLVAEATSAPQQTLIAEAVDLVIFVDQEPELAGRAQGQGSAARHRISRWPVQSRVCLNSKGRSPQ